MCDVKADAQGDKFTMLYSYVSCMKSLRFAYAKYSTIYCTNTWIELNAIGRDPLLYVPQHSSAANCKLPGTLRAWYIII